MGKYQHSVFLDLEKCKGCTHCLRRCPTEAIRIRDGHAIINSDRCIDCGECIRICPHGAKSAIYDSLNVLDKSKYNIALPPPSLYGQFENLENIDYLLKGLLDMGFDDVYEVACAAEIVTEYTRKYLARKDIKKPVISSACPVIVRLISLRFPSLVENLIPMLPPVELAGMLAKQRAKEKHPELTDDDIRTVFISPCPAKVSYIKNNIGCKSNVDICLAMKEVYFELISVMKRSYPDVPVSRTGMIGINWAVSGGESTALFNEDYLYVDGIENVIHVLDEIENEQLPASLNFIELNACNGGCVGGVLSVANPYISRVRIQNVRRYLPVSHFRFDSDKDAVEIPKEYLAEDAPSYEAVAQIDSDRKSAIRKMAEVRRIFSELPELDCGSCGSPTCRAFAEDVVKGQADISECTVMKKREQGEK